MRFRTKSRCSGGCTKLVMMSSVTSSISCVRTDLTPARYSRRRRCTSACARMLKSSLYSAFSGCRSILVALDFVRNAAMVLYEAIGRLQDSSAHVFVVFVGSFEGSLLYFPDSNVTSPRSEIHYELHSFTQ